MAAGDKCKTCEGTGKVVYLGEKVNCPACGGIGVVPGVDYSDLFP